MRKYIGTFALLIAAVLCIGDYKKVSAVENNSVAITKVNFPDKRVREKISKSFDKNKDKILSEGELQEAKKLELGAIYLSQEKTYNLQGISKLKGLTSLTVGAGTIKNISEVTKMPQLNYLEIYTSDIDGKMELLDLKNNVNLVELWVESMSIKNLFQSTKLESLTMKYCDMKNVELNNFPVLKKVSLFGCNYQVLAINNCPKLEKISGEANKKMKKITLKNLPELKRLKIGSTKKLKKLSLPELPNLESIYIEEVKELKKLSLPKLPNLESIYIEKAKKLRTLTLPRLPELRKLKIEDNTLKKINLKKFPKLREFCIWGNKEIKKLDLRPLRKLNKLVWKRGKLKKIKFGEKKNLEYMYVSHNQLGGTWKLSKFPRLMEFECSYNKIKNIYARKHKCLRELICEYNGLRKLDLYNINPYIVHFKGNPHVTAYLHDEFFTSKDAAKDWNYRFDRSAKVHYKRRY